MGQAGIYIFRHWTAHNLPVFDDVFADIGDGAVYRNRT